MTDLSKMLGMLKKRQPDPPLEKGARPGMPGIPRPDLAPPGKPWLPRQSFLRDMQKRWWKTP